MNSSKENLHVGHRKRMREKLALHGDRVFHTYELLEMLLYHAVAYKNTNSQAKSLMARFGSIDAVFSATKEELMQVDGVGEKIADMILAVGSLDLRHIPASNEKNIPIFEDYEKAGRYFVDYFKDCRGYSVVMIMLDNKMELIGKEVLYNIDFSSGAVRSSRFIDVAVRAGCAVAIIAHNHPYGPAFPGEGDIVTNNMIAGDLLEAGVTLAEHYLVSGDRFVGFMTAPPTAAFSQNSPVMRFIESKEGYNARNS